MKILIFIVGQDAFFELNNSYRSLLARDPDDMRRPVFIAIGISEALQVVPDGIILPGEDTVEYLTPLNTTLPTPTPTAEGGH